MDLHEYDRGLKLYKAGKEEEAMESLRAAAKQGDVRAAYLLSVIFKKNEELAKAYLWAAWWEKKARMDKKWSIKIGFEARAGEYELAKGLRRLAWSNYETAMECLEAAMRRRNAEAYFWAGALNAMAGDEDSALRRYEIAALADITLAYAPLGSMYAKEGHFDLEKALTWYKKAFEANMLSIAEVEKELADYELTLEDEERKLFQIIPADVYSLDTLEDLLTMIQESDGKYDDEDGIITRFLQLLADMGHIDAAFPAGEKSVYDEAVPYYLMAAEAGVTEAYSRLADCYSQLAFDADDDGDAEGHRQNAEKAVYWYKKSFDIDPNDGTAYNLGNELYGLEQYEEALVWAKKALEMAEANQSEDALDVWDAEVLVDNISECL